VEILQNCNVYNDLAWNVLYDKESKILHECRLEHGKPVMFGPPTIARSSCSKGSSPRSSRSRTYRRARSGCTTPPTAPRPCCWPQLWAPDYPIPLGTLLNIEGETTYEEILVQQEQKAISDRGPGDIAKLLMAGETWKIG
jgi:2-oxoglutarate ferredoxin oxidoreductase subunit beta